jgi:exodeoxyribonuclease V gamma subunit
VALVGLWLKHLAGCALGLDLTSLCVAPDTTLELAPLASAPAAERLAAIAAHWWQGLQQPLPVTARTALAYLSAAGAAAGGTAAAARHKGREAARLAYQGDGEHTFGELGHDGHLRRSYSDFEALWRAQDNRFTRLAEDLYGPLAAALAMWRGAA